MKKRVVSYLLALIMVIAMFNIPVSAHQEINISTDFGNYVGTWDGTTVTTGGSMPSATGGTFATFSTQSMIQA